MLLGDDASTAADALVAWVADGHDETAIALADAYTVALERPSVSPTLLEEIELVRDALDRVLVRPEVSSEVGNLLEAALERVVGALLLVRGRPYTLDVVPLVRPRR